MKDLLPALLSLNFTKRLLLIIVGVAIYVLPEVLLATINAQFTVPRRLTISAIGFILAVMGFYAIVFKHGLDDGVNREESLQQRGDKNKKE